MNVLMVDDHKVIARSLAQVLEDEPDITIVHRGINLFDAGASSLLGDATQTSDTP